ncbi:glycosyltransferase, partial [bacterium]|nr:glycosyltransferase [bacterium]
MLYKLVSKMDRSCFDIYVASLTNIGPIGEKIKKLNILVVAVGMKRGWRGFFSFSGFFKLLSIVKNYKPDVIQTWMYHSDLIGGLVGKLLKIPVIWGIHHSNLSPKYNKKTTIWTAKICAKFSKTLPKKIICCSYASKNVHSKLGYDENKMIVISNGFDLDAFLPDKQGREKVRKELGINDKIIVIGFPARFDPQKDHKNFFEAAKIVRKIYPNVHFLLCGDGISWNNKKLKEWIEKSGVKKVTYLLGRRDDMKNIYNSIDIFSSSSCGEGFPNVIGEAMACEVPCVVTDVGDSAIIVKDTGFVVPPKNPEVLAEAIIKMIEMGEEKRKELGKKARDRIKENYSIEKIVKNYEQLYKKVCV